MKTVKNAMVDFSIKRRKAVAVATLLLTVVAGAFLPNATIDTDPENMLETNEPARLFHNETKREFNLSDIVILGLVNERDPDGVFNPATLGRIFELTEFAKTLRWRDENDPEKWSGVKHELVRTTDLHYVLKNTPKKPDTVEFAYYVAFIDKETFLPARLEYYKKDDRLYRVAESLKIERIPAENDGRGGGLSDDNRILRRGSGNRKQDRNDALPYPVRYRPWRRHLHGAIPEKTSDGGLEMKRRFGGALLFQLALLLFAILCQSRVCAGQCERNAPLEFHGFFETRAGLRLQDDPEQKDVSVMESRLQAELSANAGRAEFKCKGDVWADGITERIEYDTREEWLFARPSDILDIKVGRQVLTWGTGELVFLNDLSAMRRIWPKT